MLPKRKTSHLFFIKIQIYSSSPHAILPCGIAIRKISVLFFFDEIMKRCTTPRTPPSPPSPQSPPPPLPSPTSGPSYPPPSQRPLNCPKFLLRWSPTMKIFTFFLIKILCKITLGLCLKKNKYA